jgi:hypothetical protein
MHRTGSTKLLKLCNLYFLGALKYTLHVGNTRSLLEILQQSYIDLHFYATYHPKGEQAWFPTIYLFT